MIPKKGLLEDMPEILSSFLGVGDRDEESERFRVRLTGLADYSSIAHLVERRTRGLQANSSRTPSCRSTGQGGFFSNLMGFNATIPTVTISIGEVGPANLARESGVRELSGKESETEPRSHKPPLPNGRFGNCNMQGNSPTLRQPFANPSPTFRRPFANPFCQPLANPLFPWTPGTRLETRVNGFLAEFANPLRLGNPVAKALNRGSRTRFRTPSLWFGLSGQVKRPGNRQFRKLMGFSHGSLRYLSWHQNTVKQAFGVP